jgi:4-hydroxy-tetrahydrodipicolinate synthase
MPKPLWPSGVLPAVVTPFKPDGSFDAEAFTRYVDHVIGIDGVTGLLCNGYTGEGSSLSREEKCSVVQICARGADGRIPVFAGVEAPSTRTAIEAAKDARDSGATGIQINSPFYNFVRRGFLTDPQPAVQFFHTLSDEVGLPMTIFQYPAWSGLTYPPATLAELAKIDNLVGIKEAVDMDTFLDDVDVLRGKVSIIADNNTYTLLSMLFYGADATMIGISNVGTELYTELFAAAKSGDRSGAVDLANERIVPLMDVFARGLGTTSWSFIARVKEALVLLGLLPHATVRGPDLQATDADRRAVQDALTASGLIH